MTIIPFLNGYFIGNINPTFSGPNQHLFHQISVGFLRLFSASSSRMELCLQTGSKTGISRQSMGLGIWNQGEVNQIRVLESGGLCQLLGYMGGVYGNFQIPTISENEFYIPQDFNDGNVARETWKYLDQSMGKVGNHLEQHWSTGAQILAGWDGKL